MLKIGFATGHSFALGNIFPQAGQNELLHINAEIEMVQDSLSKQVPANTLQVSGCQKQVAQVQETRDSPEVAVSLAHRKAHRSLPVHSRIGLTLRKAGLHLDLTLKHEPKSKFDGLKDNIILATAAALDAMNFPVVKVRC
jgi:hypothetical protein